MTENLYISIVIPFYNEQESLSALYDAITNVLDPSGHSYEIIFVDDGSSDHSNQIIRSLQKKDERIKLITLASNSGKAAALNQGFLAAKGEIVFTMDADLQDDPKEIPFFIEKIHEGYDLVSGWKKKRFDPLEKKLPSKLFNQITSYIAGIKLHDFNCGFKAYRHELIKELNIYGDLHRFIPVLAHWKGFRVCEIPVQHHARKFGESKYGWRRYYQGFFDLFTVILLTRYSRRPIYFFGLTGLATSFAGFCILFFITCLQVMHGSIMGHKPLSYLGVLSILLGSQMVATGLIAEMLVSLTSRKEKLFSILDVFSRGKPPLPCDQTIIIPLQNETEFLSAFLKILTKDVTSCGKASEVIFIDDGSDDGTADIIRRYQFTDNFAIKLIRLRRSFGYAAALQAGYDYASGKNIVILPIGMQNIRVNVERITSGLNGDMKIIKGRRTGMPLPERFISRIINRLISSLTGVKIVDHHCDFYAIEKGAVEKLKPYGQYHLFFPVIASKIAGINFSEVEIPFADFRPLALREKLKRIFTDLLDVLVIKISLDFMARPLHLFGLIGILIGMVGFFINSYLTILKILTGSTDGHYTLLLMGVTLMIIGAQWLTTGLLGEIINNIRQNKNNDS